MSPSHPTALENLIIAQVVYTRSTDDMAGLASKLNSHALVRIQAPSLEPWREDTVKEAYLALFDIHALDETKEDLHDSQDLDPDAGELPYVAKGSPAAKQVVDQCFGEYYIMYSTQLYNTEQDFAAKARKLQRAMNDEPSDDEAESTSAEPALAPTPVFPVDNGTGGLGGAAVNAPAQVEESSSSTSASEVD